MVVVKKKLQMTLSYSITLLFQPIVLVLAEPVGLYHAKLRPSAAVVWKNRLKNVYLFSCPYIFITIFYLAGLLAYPDDPKSSVFWAFFQTISASYEKNPAAIC